MKWVNYVGRLQVVWPNRMMQRGGGTDLVLAFPLSMVPLATFQQPAYVINPLLPP